MNAEALSESGPTAFDECSPSLAAELAAIPYEPLLPAEKKLIALSLLLGVLLLGLLVWLSSTFFPVTPAQMPARTQTPSRAS